MHRRRATSALAGPTLRPVRERKRVRVSTTPPPAPGRVRREPAAEMLPRRPRNPTDPDWVVGGDGMVAFWTLESRSGGKAVEMALATMEMLPAGAERECPISMEPFDALGVVDVIGDRSFCEAEPEYCVGVLPCGHAFSAVAILYHMAMSNLRCCVCRGGPKLKMKMRSVPSHFRKQVTESARSALERERREMDNESAEVARSVLLEGGLLEMLANAGALTTGMSEILAAQQRMLVDEQFPLSMSFYMMGHTTRTVISYCEVINADTGERQRRPVRATVSEYSTFDVKEAPLLSTGPLEYAVQATDVGYLTEYMEQTRWDALRITVHTRDYGGMPVDVGNTQAIQTNSMADMLRHPENSVTIQCAGGTLLFHFRDRHIGNDVLGEPSEVPHAFVRHLRGVSWRADPTAFAEAIGVIGD